MRSDQATRVQFWLNSAPRLCIYVAAWLTFASGFAAVFVLANKTALDVAVVRSLNVVLPAAIWGVAAIWVCTWIPPAWSWKLLLHAPLAMAYAAVWTTSVSTWGALRAFWASSHWHWTMPPTHVLHWHGFTGVLIYISLAGFTYTLHYAAVAEADRHRAEIQALRAQLNPHFLYNTLHSVMALVRADAGAAEQAIERLAGMLRYALRRDVTPFDAARLSDEWSFTKDYLDLERLRLAERLCVQSQVDDDTLHCRVPSMVLQPLVENAIRHGIAPRATGGLVAIRCQRINSTLVLTVRDNGGGAEPATLERAQGIGLAAIRSRLESFGQGSSLDIRTGPGEGFVATVRLRIADEEL